MSSQVRNGFNFGTHCEYQLGLKCELRYGISRKLD